MILSSNILKTGIKIIFKGLIEIIMLNFHRFKKNVFPYINIYLSFINLKKLLWIFLKYN